jgi:nucleotide-binding universal stress UspA family protein
VVTPGDTIEYIGDDETLHQVAEQALQDLCNSLRGQVPQGTSLRYFTDTRMLEEINEIALDEGAELIVMGVTGKGKLEEMVAGSHAIRVCEASDLPVVLVPAHIPMQPVSNLVFACDMEALQETLPRQNISKVLDTFHVPLSVVHVGKETEATKTLYGWLKDYNAAYHNIDQEDTGAAILDFAKGIPSPILLVVAKKHSFPTGLFHHSITKQLAFHATVPLLVLREKENEVPLPVMPLLEI